MTIASKNQVCNMALSHMGNYGSVNDIDNPKDSKEITFSLWYDVTRQAALRLLVPNFAMQRRIIANIPVPPEYAATYTNAFTKPADCVKVLGIGEIDGEDTLTLEGAYILTNDNYPSGLPLRFIGDITDTTAFTPDFTILFSLMLAENTAIQITQKQTVKDKITAQLPAKLSESSGISAQENKPIRVNRSKALRSRLFAQRRSGTKA